MMSIDNPDVVDGAAIDENGVLILLATDHWVWEGEEALITEAEHLMMIQDKLNSYVAYIEDEQFKQTFPGVDVAAAVVRIAFMYDIPENCRKLLQYAQDLVQDQIDVLDITIEAQIDATGVTLARRFL